jgi:hypothetical protein
VSLLAERFEAVPESLDLLADDAGLRGVTRGRGDALSEGAGPDLALDPRLLGAHDRGELFSGRQRPVPVRLFLDRRARVRPDSRCVSRSGTDADHREGAERADDDQQGRRDG